MTIHIPKFSGGISTSREDILSVWGESGIGNSRGMSAQSTHWSGYGSLCVGGFVENKKAEKKEERLHFGGFWERNLF
jgi:hypothetical protein